MDKTYLNKIYNSKKKRLDTSTGKVTPGFEEITFDTFLDWFLHSKFIDGCYYCGTTNEQSSRLYEIRKNRTRGGKRGKRLEMDRINPDLPYDSLDNVVWCCYWCNNAKSNFFSGQEFKSIAVEMGKALRRILED